MHKEDNLINDTLLMILIVVNINEKKIKSLGGLSLFPKNQ